MESAVSFLGRDAGPSDNRALEARPDVLVYTSEPLERDLEVIGPVEAELWVRSSLGHADFLARLCDVEPTGRSVNVSYALLRVSPGLPEHEADGILPPADRAVADGVPLRNGAPNKAAGRKRRPPPPREEHRTR